MELRSDGKSYNSIIRVVEQELGIRLSKSHVSNWTRGKHLPLGRVASFDGEPTEDLAYVVGAVLGDGSFGTVGDNYHRVRLRVNDKDFAEAFAKSLGSVLKRPPPKLKFNRKRNMWHVEVASILLLQFLDKPVQELAPSVEHCDRCSGAFLRGLFDSEGSITRRSLRLYNGDLELISYAQTRLEGLGIFTTGPHLRMAAGGQVMIQGQLRNRNLNEYYLQIRTLSLITFRERIGFSIMRKQRRLIDVT